MAKKKRGAPSPAPESAEAPKENREAPAKKGRTMWKSGLDFIVMIAMAVVIALLIKAYILDVYLIPSGSMETALHGRPDGGDRILCSKLNYHFRDPERWEVAVFIFPYETARRSDPHNISEQYKGQNFVKRVVGLPGEHLAISRGDIWTRPLDSKGKHTRAVKPDSVQRGMWLNVYEENFSDIDVQELGTFWKILGGDAEVAPGGQLRLSPGEGGVRMDYRPMVPVGSGVKQMVELPGVPDRYTLEQPVQFRCLATDANGDACGHVFMKSIHTQNIQARCPKCGKLQDESAVIFYHRRSGLPVLGRYAVDPRYAVQGEKVRDRESDYHLVPDLRVVADFIPETAASRLTLVLREDNRFVQATLSPDGIVEISRNGEPSRPEQRMTATIRPGKKHRVEFYVVDGTARLFLDSTETALLDIPVWKDDERAHPRNLPRASGVSLAASGGGVTVSRLAIDRDIFYYSGWELDRGEKLAHMNSQGEVTISRDGFFPMGDHCPSSFDARSWGPVPLSLLRGPAILVWWPPERAGLIASP